jgi:membrane-anchored protein YejM (alkaline phosphatase superfamily)
LSDRLSTAYASAFDTLQKAQPVDNGVVIPADRRPHVVLFVLESLRHTALAADTMPRLCRRAEQGLRCGQHYAGSNLSHYGLFSLLYGRSPLVFDQTLDAQVPPQLCRTLKRNGYTTSFITSGACDDWQRMGEFLNERTFDRVVTHDDASWVDRDRKTLDLVRRTVLEAPADEPQFVVAFLMSTHFNYEFPPEFALHTPYAQDLSLVSLRDSAAVLNRYRNAASFLDHAVDETIAGLDLDQTLVVVTGDHGESLMDDGMLFHGSRLSEIQTRVPCFLFGAGVDPGATAFPTSHADLLPTLVRLLTGQPPAIAGCHGRSLVGLGHDDAPPHLLLMHGVFNLKNARTSDRALFIDDNLRVALQLWRNEPTVRVTAFVNDRDVMLPAPVLSEKRLDQLVRAFGSEMSRFAPAASSPSPSAVVSARP